MVQLSHSYMTTGKTIALTLQTFVSNVMSLPFYTLARSIITFLPRSKCLLISCKLSPFTVILEPKKKENLSLFPLFPFYLTWSDGTGYHDLSFWMLSFKLAFSLSSFTFIKRFFQPKKSFSLGKYTSALECPKCIVPFIIFKSNKNPVLEITLKINFGREGNGNPLHIPARGTHGQKSQVGYSPWGHKELDVTLQLNNNNCIGQELCSVFCDKP